MISETIKDVPRLISVVIALGYVGAVSAADPPALKDVFVDDFRVGVALGTAQIMGDDPKSLELAARQFNSITPENVLKWAEVHPERDKYNFDPADKFVAFGEQHGMFIVGHNLVWHNQTPPWVFVDDSKQPLSRDALLKRMEDHIQSVVGRYKGRINAWDVVNEGIDDNGELRQTPWRQIIGDDYVERAFAFAHAADPNAELYYNDYNEWHPAKRRAIANLVRSLQAKGVRIDGIGLQGHWGMDYPSLDEVNAMFEDYGKLGVKLMITELDIDVLPRATHDSGAEVNRKAALTDKLNPYRAGLPPEKDRALAKRYGELFQLFVKHRDKLDRVTFWGVHDGQSWLNDWPVRGRTSYPLLFDRELQRKLAFEAVSLAAKSRSSKAANSTVGADADKQQ